MSLPFTPFAFSSLRIFNVVTPRNAGILAHLQCLMSPALHAAHSGTVLERPYRDVTDAAVLVPYGDAFTVGKSVAARSPIFRP
jgi:hypothetical protein